MALAFARISRAASRWAAHAALVASVGAAACGGASASASSRSAERVHADHGDDVSERASGDDESESSGGSSEAAGAALSCDDGTCFECGDGICPKGFYCDEGAAGGAACSWLPRCAAQPSCKCVRETLGAGCSCEERAGGLFVSCR